jgi:tetratricopeptide (TPR) repeat protein
LLRALGDRAVRSLTLITSRERLRESALSVQPYLLGSLDQEAWRLYFESRQVQIDNNALIEIHRAYGGNAKAMEILCSVILQDYQGRLIGYWHDNQNDLLIERDLEDLVVGQFDRLRGHDLTVYSLLCRMGCYRYSDIPSVAINGLFCLLWDVKEKEKSKAISQLRDRSLIECDQGKYWLHPIIKQVARTRLKEDVLNWEKSNQNAAEFWQINIQEIKSINDAMFAIEAYHHYLTIEDFDSASSVILQKRSIKDIPAERLGAAFYRLGLLEKIRSKIARIIDVVEKQENLIYLHNIIGDAYWMTGDASKGIEHHLESGRISKKIILSSKTKPDLMRGSIRYYILHFFNIALCKIDLRELNAALDFAGRSYQAVLDYNVDITDSVHVDAFYLLAYLNAILNRRKESKIFIELYNQNIKQVLYLETSWASVYGPIFIGSAYMLLNNFDKASEMYGKAISRSKDFKYIQAESKALNGLAEIERIKGNFSDAKSKNLWAIESCLKIGAKYDLAESYFQMGLTCQAMGEQENSNENFRKSIDLFSELNAPIQIERVSKAMVNRSLTHRSFDDFD